MLFIVRDLTETIIFMDGRCAFSIRKASFIIDCQWCHLLKLRIVERTYSTFYCKINIIESVTDTASTLFYKISMLTIKSFSFQLRYVIIESN